MNQLAVLTFLAACFAVSHGLKCFVCNETAIASGDTCGDPFNATTATAKSFIQECVSPNDKFCAKEFTGHSKVAQITERYCANQCENLNLGVHKKKCCDKDLCNGSPPSFWAFSPLIAFAIVSLYTFFK